MPLIRNPQLTYLRRRTITTNGQTTVPQPIREALRPAQPGTRLTWNVMPDGTIVVRAKNKSILGGHWHGENELPLRVGKSPTTCQA